MEAAEEVRRSSAELEAAQREAERVAAELQRFRDYARRNFERREDADDDDFPGGRRVTVIKRRRQE